MIARQLALLLAVSARLVAAEAPALAPTGARSLRQADELPIFCPMEYDPVCGSDGTTYSSKCELGIALRDYVLDLEVDYDGECCVDRVCMLEFMGVDALDPPVCATDGNEYTSACAFLSAQCDARQKLWPVPAECCKHDGASANPICSPPS